MSSRVGGRYVMQPCSRTTITGGCYVQSSHVITQESVVLGGTLLLRLHRIRVENVHEKWPFALAVALPFRASVSCRPHQDIGGGIIWYKGRLICI